MTKDEKKSTPDEKQSTPDEKQSTPEEKQSTPEEKQSTPDEKQPTSEEKQSTPEEKKSTTGNPQFPDKNDLFKKTDFHIVFKVDVADARVKAKVVSSDDLRTGEPTLADLRTLGNLSPRYHFCFPDDENIIPEKTAILSYLFSIDANATALTNANKAKSTAILTVHCTSKSTSTRRRGEAAKPHIPVPSLSKLSKDKSGTDLQVDPLKDPTPTPKIDTAGMLSGGDSELKYTHPADMTADDWNLVMLTNSLLHGLIFDPKRKTLKIAREPAFQLKYSYPDPFKNAAGAELPQTAPTKAPGDNSQEPVLCVPAFRVTDDSSVTITLLKNSFQKSMAKQSFSSWEIEAAISGGYGPISGEASGGYSESSTKAYKEATQDNKESILASYNFPRVTVILDPDDLELSESCKKFFDIKPFNPDKFYAKFGILFPCSVLLGARLESTNESTLFSKGTEDKSDEDKKARFSASLSSPWVSGSISGSKADRTQSNVQTKEENSSVNLHWEARGGETHLSTNPTAWIRTITPYRNWRVIERDDVRNVLDIVKTISPNTTHSTTRFNVFDIPKNKTWLFANSGCLLGSTQVAVQLQSSDQTLLDEVGLGEEWIVEFEDDRKLITIASFEKKTLENQRYYVTPQAISDGSHVQLKKAQPYKWWIQQDSGSASVFIFLRGDNDKPNLALTTVTVADSKLDVQLKPLDPKNDKQKWSVKEGSQTW